MNLEAKYPDIQVELTGQDGNIFSIIARVSRALRRAKVDQEIVDTFAKEVCDSKSYDAALQVVLKWVDIV